MVDDGFGEHRLVSRNLLAMRSTNGEKRYTHEMPRLRNQYICHVSRAISNHANSGFFGRGPRNIGRIVKLLLELRWKEFQLGK
jgi:hypothetical protein